MPALSAREMLARLPVRNMARGGSVGEDYTEGLGDLDAQIQADIQEERRLRAEEAAAREAAAKAEADAKAAAEAKAAADKAAADAAEKAAKDAADKAAAEAKAAADKAAEEAAAAAAKAEADAAAAKAAADAAAKAEADAAAKLAGDINLSAEAAYDKSAAYKRAQETGGSQGVLQYYEDLRTLADKYMAGEGQFEGNQPVGADAYNAMLESGISNTDLINAGVGDDVLTKIWTTASSDPTLDSPTDVESAYMTNSVLAAEAARISAEGRDGVAALQTQGKAYVEDAQKDGLTQDEINTLRELALEGGYTLDDIRAAGVDPSILFYVPEKKKEEATTKVCPEGTRLAGQTVGINADCGTITKATTKVCPEGTRLAGQTVDINADCGTITTGPTTKVCPQGTQLAGQTVDINADCGTITGPTTKVCPEGTQFAGQTVDINTDCGTLTNPSTPQIKICPPGTKRAGEQIPVSMPCGVLEPRTKLCPAGTIKAGQYIAESEDCGTPFPEVVTDTGTGADSATGVVTYDPVAFEKEQAGADIYEKGQPALDVAFRESDPRTEVTQDIFGEQQLVGFDYLPAAQLLSATGSGFSFTPPSVTSRPRTLMPTSQLGRYTRGRAAQDLQQLLGPNRAISFPDASGQMQQTTLYDRYKPLLDRGGSYGGGLSRSQLYALMRRQEAEDAQRLGIGAYTPGTVPTQAAQAQTATGTIADYIALNPDVQEDFISQSESGAIPGISLEQFALDHYNKFGLDEMAKGMRTPFSLTGGYTGTTTGFNAPITPYDFGPSGGVRFFADGGNVVKKPKGYADGGSVPETDFDALQQQLLELDRQAIERDVRSVAQAPRATDQETRTESRGMLERLNQNLFEKVTKPVLGSALDMTVGLGDLAQLGVKKGAEALGMETKPFVPVSQRLQESAGVAGYDPYAPAAVATQILPFARAKQAGTVAATELGRLFPSLGRETAAYGGSEIAAAGAREFMPDSTAAELLASVAGGTLTDIGSTGMTRRMADDVPPPTDTESSRMLDDIAQATVPETIKLSRAENAVINEKVGTSRKNRQAAKAEAQRIKSNYSPAEGWAPIQVSNIKKDKQGNPNKVEFKKIPYGFQRPPEGVDVEVWKRKLTDGIVGEVDDVVRRAQQGDQAALDILAQANWYRGMRDQLRSEFGGIGDVFADILGTTSAQTNVEQNFKNAVEILRRYSRGEYDNELAAYQRRIDQGLPVDGKTLTRLHKEGEFPLITKAGGELFNTNSPSSMGALLDMFRSVKTGSSPKTPNFTGNLIGLTNEATVDVWAARMLRRMAEQPRIPPAAEQGVSGSHLVGSSLYEPRVGGEFGFGQDVFRDAARRVNESGSIRSVSPELGDLGPDDLQAVAWFIEKERWTNNGWTTKAGEGGSLEYEMSLAGAPDQARVDELRRSINQGFKTPARRKTETDAEYEGRVAVARRTFDDNRDQMQAELSIMEAPLQRYQLGVAGERPNQPMSGYAQAELASEFDDVARNDESVLTYNLANTYGSFMGDTERALNAEFVVRQNFNPEALRRRLVEQGRAYDQDAVFMSRVVSADTPNARPGVEIYFKESITPAQMAKVTERLREKGVDGFTYVTDMRFDDRINRQTRSGDPETAALTGLRFQYVPEFDDAFDPARSSEIYAEQADLFRDVVADTIADGNVSDARMTYYDTEVYFRDDYDDYLTRSAPEGNPEARRELATGADDSQSNRSGEGRPEPPEPVRDRGGQAATNKRGKVTFAAFGGSLGDARQKLGITPEKIEEFKAANKGIKQTRIPEVQDAAKKLKAGEITTQEYLQTVEKFQPIKPLGAVQKRPTNEDIAMSLTKNEDDSAGIVGVNLDVPDGTMISSRLDIPAYETNDTWVVTLHDGSVKNGLAVGYGQTAVLNGVEFVSNPKAALNMAAGGPKGTIARINGSWENHDSAAIEKLAQDILDGTAPDADQWTEVGMNPFRHSYFYRKSDGMPVANAEQVIQIGPLVLAKKVETRPVESPEHEIKTPQGTRYFKGGGDVDRKDDNRTYI